MSRDESNPLIGKIQQFVKKVSWLPENLRSGFKPVRFRHRFKVFADWSDPFVYYPPEVGGLGFCQVEEPTDEILLKTTRIHMEAFNRVSSGQYSPDILAALWSIRSNSSYRGIESNTAMIAQIRGIIDMMYGGGAMTASTIRDMYPEIDDLTWSRYRWKKVEWLAKSKGYLSTVAVMENLQRPLYFRNVMYREDWIVNAQPEVKELKALNPEIMDHCLMVGLSLDEFISQGSDLAKNFTKVRAAAKERARQVQIFGSDLLNGKPVPKFMELIEKPDTKGFNTKKWENRVRDSAHSLLFFSNLSGSELNLETLKEIILKGRCGKSIITTDTFVPANVLETSCDLTVEIGLSISELSFMPVNGVTQPSHLALKEKILSENM